jgi:DNA-binding IclR family transcriptional regulator
MTDRKDGNLAVEKYRAPALEKGLALLELFAQHSEGLTLAEVIRALDRSQSEIYRMLATLVRSGYVVRSETDDRYSLSLKMFALSQRHPPMARLLEIALPLMRSVTRQAWQSCHLGVENNGDIVITASIEAPGNWGLAIRTGSVVGLGNTGTGRVIAAFRSDEEVNDLLERHKLAVGEPPIDRNRFFDDLSRIRERGYEHLKSETTIGVTNLAFPVFDPHQNVMTVVSCPFIERIDSLKTPDIEEVVELYSNLAATLSASFSNAADSVLAAE